MKIWGKNFQVITFILIVILLIFMFSGCTTLVSTTKMNTTEVADSKVKTGEKKYTYKQVKSPNPDDPEMELKFEQREQYRILTKTKYKNQYQLSPFGKTWQVTSGIIATPAIIFGAMEVGNYIFEGDDFLVSPGIHLLSALLFVEFIRLTRINMKGKTKYTFETDFQNKYEDPFTMSNFNINVNHQDKSITKTTNHNGRLTFNPVQDFNITQAKNDKGLTFGLTSHVHDFGTFHLGPSLWMHKYARITVPECFIRNSYNQFNMQRDSIRFTTQTGNRLGIARRNMEYRILWEKDNAFEIELYNKTGWINSYCAKTFYSIPRKKDVTAAIKSYVEDKMNAWQKQGEFESPENYQKRMLKKKDQLNKFTREAMQIFQQDYASLIAWGKSEISRYDPNSETFKITIPDLEEIILPVPIEKAREFKENWKNVKIKNSQFVLVDGNWELSSLDFSNDNINYTAQYDSKISHVYDPTNQFAFDLEPIDIVIPAQTTRAEKTEEVLDNYSINTNLPATKTMNPDAIAVVIGNANYRYTQPVNFAINDAQLMKVYLTNVLGFKPGNIIFMKNATKAEFEGMFGTESNFKGRLNDLVKAGKSDVFVYYSGHGAPGINDKKGYFVPVDADPIRVELQGYPLEVFYENLAKIPAKTTTVVLDACFSGAGIIKNISSIRIQPKEITQQIDNSAILTSSTGEEVSSWYVAKQHGLFTYFFLKAIHDHKNSDKNNDNKITINEIYGYISDKTEGVPYYARRLNQVQQNPTIQGTDRERVLIELTEPEN